MGDFQDAFALVNQSLAAYPGHDDARELRDALQKMFTTS
jgi:hypothetical protein